MNDQKSKKTAISFLYEKGCCLRCCLRFIDSSFHDQTKAYRKILTTLKDYKYIDDDFQINEEKPCVTCLGILQEKNINNVVEQIIKKVEGQYDGLNFFSCTLTIPSFVYIRERSMQICVAKNFNIVDDDLQKYKDSLKSVKDIWRWCSYTKLEQALGVKYGYVACNGSAGCSGCVQCIPSLIIDVFFSHPNHNDECKILTSKFGDDSQNKRKRSKDDTCSRRSIETLLNRLKDDEFVSTYSVPPTMVDMFIEIDNIVSTHSSIYIGGRYLKLSRSLSQTPWFINGEKKMETSLQEIIFESIEKFINLGSMKFLSSGREDVDVRMLHNGRPFAVEMIDPKTAKISAEILSNIANDINLSNDVKIISGLKVLENSHLVKLKEGENEKTKNYRALCVYKSKPEKPELLEKLNEMKELDIEQTTPIRVLHRRSLMSRTRKIHEIHARKLIDISPNVPKDFLKPSENIEDFFIVDVKTQAGTYVKEFVHGDFGRTVPNLCQLLGAEVDILALDVTGIDLEWP